MTGPRRFLACLCVTAAALLAAGSGGRGENGRPQVITGAHVLAESGFELLSGRRVGLIANHTSRVGEDHLADLLHAAPDVTLAALFGPEHGIRGDADASEAIADARDARTGVPVYSLYGKTRRPTPRMLRGVDVLVFDIQDIGARFYTYISTMGLAMQAAARARIPFVVLDRPNPLGGTYVAGFSVHRHNISFVSQFPVPQAHGLTVGELARLIQSEALLPGLSRLRLEVVAMKGWKRSMLWPDTGLEWVATSPAIPDFETALVYPGTGYFEATAASEGRGTELPFKQVGAPWADAERLAGRLTERRLPGVRFEATRFTPRREPWMTISPKAAGRECGGVRIVVTDPRAYRPVETGVYILQAFRAEARRKRASFINRPDWLARLAGTTRLNGMLRRGAAPEEIIAAWQKDVAAFEALRKPYLLYE